MKKRDRAVPGAPGLRRGYGRGYGRGALAAASALLLAGLVMSTATAGQQQWSGTAGGGKPASVPVTTLDDTSGQAAAKALSFLSEDELARRQAKLSGERVELASQRTETSTTYVNPDGTLTTESYAGPVRVKDENGSWQDIDTELSDEGPALEPEAAAADITVSDGGDKRLASVTEGSASLALGWEDTLPTPKVTGDTAAYDLGEGQTLTVTALKEGFSQNVVLDEAPDGDLTYRIPVTLKGLTLSEADSGHLLLRNTAGDLVAEAPAPMMWDSSKDAVSGESRHLASVDTDIETAADGTQTLVLHRDADYFAQDLTYPVTVDPTSTLAVTTDTWVATNYTDSQISSTELKSGTYNGGDTVARSYLKFDVSDFVGTHITDTNLALYSYWSSSCTGGTGTAVRRITESWSSSDITWSTKPAGTTTGQVINTAAKGYSSACPAGTMNFDIDDIVQAWANGTANYGLMIRGLDETDSYTWRRFRSANYVSGDGSTEPHLTVTYNSYPKTPGSLTLAPSTTSGSEKVVTSLTPVFSAKVSDVDSGAKVRVQYAIEPDPDYADTSYTLTQSSAYVSSGKATALTVPSTSPLPDGTHLRIRARAYDGTDYSTAWTSWQTFTVDTGALDIPEVPGDLQTGAVETSTPLLTAVATALGQDDIATQYLLYDSTGAVVGTSPLGTATVASGERAAFQVPDGLLTDKATYKWKARACVGTVCSSYSSLKSFTVDVAAADTTTPDDDTTGTAPTAVTELTARAGEKGALVTWAPSRFTGDEDDEVTYTVVAKLGTTTAATTTTTGTSAVLTGLANGSAYTFTVTPANDYGTGTAATSASVTPVAVTGGTAAYTTVLAEYLAAQNALLNGDQAGAATAAEASDSGDAFSDVLDAEQATPLTERAGVTGDDMDAEEPASTLTDVLAMPGTTGSTVDLRATATTTATYVSGVDGSTPDATDDAGVSTDVYTFTAGTAPVLTGHTTADADEATVSEGAEALADFGESVDTGTLDDTDDASAFDGDSVNINNTVTSVSYDAQQASVSMSYGGIASWAVAHAHQAAMYSQDCTNFVSRALHLGGGMKKKYDSYAYLNEGDLDYWWRYKGKIYDYNQSKTWINAAALKNFVYHWAYWTSHSTSSAQVGDVIFYDWDPSAKDGVEHSSVISKIDANGKIFVAQHNRNFAYRPLTTQKKLVPDMKIWIYKVYPEWYS
ncbi:DNRLRE domain-containing protein [Streptomyces sp. NPDC048288]|uniref:DNRLRE domain-containing protein n=1 Tax=Streptomyces sp. NPDC048288 TaxID=3365529 RepID=UPI00371E4B8C